MILVAAVLGGMLAPASPRAETPSVSYIYPAGGQRGTTVKFVVGGHYLHGASAFEMRGSGLTASTRVVEVPTRWFEGPLVVKPESQAAENYPRDHAGEVVISADAPPGEANWRVWTSQGATPSRPFAVGVLPEVLEDEMEGKPLPQQVELPVTANGRIFPREDLDIWSFHAEAGQKITCEVRAARLASPLDSQIEVLGPDGLRLAENDDRHGADSWLRFTAPSTGTYQVRIWDAEFRGLQDFVYRLTLTAGPYIDHVYPLGGRAGETLRARAVGQNLPPEQLSLALPAGRTGLALLTPSVAGGVVNPVLVDVGEPSRTEVVEEVEAVAAAAGEANLSSVGSAGNPVRLPAVINGCLREPGETDSWSFLATAGQSVEFQVLSARLGSPLDAVVSVFRGDSRESLLTGGSSIDNRAEFTGTLAIPADGLYRVEVRDVVGSRGGPEFAYRLRLQPQPRPDFQVHLPTDALTLFRGGEAKMKVSVERLAGFAGEVRLVLAGLPAGVTVTGDQIDAGKPETELVLKADAKAKVQAAFVTLDGVAQVGEDQVVRRAVMAVPPTSHARDNLLLAVAMPTPFLFDGGELQLRYGSRGTVFRRKFALQRNGFKGPLTVRLADRQIRHLQGVTGPTLEVPPDAEEFVYPVQLPTWLETNRTSRITVMAIGEVADEDGVKHKVSFSSGDTRNQIALLTAPCPLSVRTDRGSILAAPLAACELGVTISRGKLPPASVTVELLPQAHVSGIAAERLTIPAAETRGVLRIHFSDRPGPFTMPFVLRATTMHAGDPVIAECRFEIATR